MRHTLFGYLVAIVVGAVVGTGSAIMAPHMFGASNIESAAESQWLDELELAVDEPQPIQRHARAIGVTGDQPLDLDLAGDKAPR